MSERVQTIVGRFVLLALSRKASAEFSSLFALPASLIGTLLAYDLLSNYKGVFWGREPVIAFCWSDFVVAFVEVLFVAMKNCYGIFGQIYVCGLVLAGIRIVFGGLLLFLCLAYSHLRYSSLAPRP